MFGAFVKFLLYALVLNAGCGQCKERNSKVTKVALARHHLYPPLLVSVSAREP